MSRPENYNYVTAAKDYAEKRRRIEELNRRFRQSNFSSGYVEDDGNNSGITGDDFYLPERQETAINDIRRLLVKEDVRESTQDYLNRRNATIRRNRKDSVWKTSRPKG